MLSAYHVLIFTDFAPDYAEIASGLNFKEQVGWSMVIFIFVNLVINMGIILREFILEVIDKFRQSRAKALRLKLDKLFMEQKEI